MKKVTVLKNADGGAFVGGVNKLLEDGWKILSCGFNHYIWWAILEEEKDG